MRESLEATIARLREASGRTQAQLARELGVSTSRIGQIESVAKSPEIPNPNPATGDLLLNLAALLGTDILAAARLGIYDSDRKTWDDAIAALWRFRIDVLSDPRVSAGSDSDRDRTLKLAKAMESAACRAPEARRHVSNGRLASLEHIAKSLPPDTKAVLIVEVAAMKLDAPIHILGPDGRKAARKVVAEMADERLGLDASAAMKSYSVPPRGRWRWDELMCVGGPVGEVHALCTGDPGALLLRGHDPSGWFGWGASAGAWIARYPMAADPATTSSDPAEHASDSWQKSLSLVSQRGANLAGSNVGLSPLQRVFLPAVADQRLLQGAFSADRTAGTSLPWLEADDVATRTVLLTASALGRHWMRAQVNRLIALYEGFDFVRPGTEVEGLPSLDHTQELLRRFGEAASDYVKFEQRQGGTSDPDKNVPLKTWVDIRDSFRAGEKRLDRIQRE